MAKLLLLSGLSVLTLLLACEATVFMVGDSAGWDTSADLISWPVVRIFKVGDVLLFQYSNYHTVNQVDKNGYDTCNATNALFTSSDGNTSIPLTTSGEMYFICSNPPHCFGGMKLHVNVKSNQTGPSTVAASPELSLGTPPPPTPTTNGDFLPPFLSGIDHGGRSHALFITLCFNFGALWWLLMLKV